RTEFREEVWKQLAEGFRFVPGNFDDDQAFNQLRRTIEELDDVRGTGGNHAFYLAIPPGFFGDVVGQLKEHELAEPAPGSWRRVVVEKPFGHDEDSARELNATLATVFPSGSIFRIDHYLGKETVQNVLATRFANTMFEPIWNDNYVDHVQITMAEDIGIAGRAGYYDGIVFFFQAEDGIRVLIVTGVQRCALPISPGNGTRSGPRSQVPGTTAIRHRV